MFSFFINLRGKVSIYINHKKHDENEEDIELNDQNHQDSSDSMVSNPYLDAVQTNAQLKSKRIREKLGNYVTSLGAGEGFGEVALVSDDTRTASIIADEVTDLMIVNKNLYAR